MKTINERKQLFKENVWQKIGKNFEKYPKDLVVEFVEHWTTVNDNGNKMYFEMKSITKGKWSTLGRLATFMRNKKRWEEQRNKMIANNGEKMPNFFKKTYWQKVQGEKLVEYKKHLIYLGWFYQTSPGGTYWKSPEGKMIWL